MNDEGSTINQPEGDDPTSRGAHDAPQGGAFGGKAWSAEPPTEPTQPQDRPAEAETTRPRRLLRSSDDRVLAGVAGGLGRYFGIDPLIFRIGFALSLFFGGFGGLAYLLLAVFVPTDGDPDRAHRLGRRLRRGGFWRGLGLVLIAALLLSGLVALAGGAAFAVAVGWGVPLAIVIIAIGGLLALAAFRGGARWLIPPAVALTIGAGVAAAADLDFRGGIGEREYHPIAAESIPANGYRLGVGRLTVDLRDLDWSKDKVVPLHVDLGAGQANVLVPERVCVVGSTHIGAGESEVVGEQDDGFDIDHRVGGGSGAVPRLELDAHVDMGQLRVINSNTASVDNPGYGPGPFHEDTAPLRAAEAKACGTG
jgi:phage shock protein PspC (stress-responsive transcriptional regulator)